MQLSRYCIVGVLAALTIAAAPRSVRAGQAPATPAAAPPTAAPQAPPAGPIAATDIAGESEVTLFLAGTRVGARDVGHRPGDGPT